jgi:hypothetical protein
LELDREKAAQQNDNALVLDDFDDSTEEESDDDAARVAGNDGRPIDDDRPIDSPAAGNAHPIAAVVVDADRRDDSTAMTLTDTQAFAPHLHLPNALVLFSFFYQEICGKPEGWWKRHLGILVKSDTYGRKNNKDKLLINILRSGFGTMSNALENPPDWMKPLDYASKLPTEVMEEHIVDKVFKLAVLMDDENSPQKTVLRRTGAKFWIDYLFQDKEVKKDHLTFVLGELGVSFNQRATKLLLGSTIVASFFGRGSDVHVYFQAYGTFKKASLTDELVEQLVPYFDPLDSSLPPREASFEDLLYLCWCDFNVLREILVEEPCEAPVSSSSATSAERLHYILEACKKMGSECHAIVYDAAMGRVDVGALDNRFDLLLQMAMSYSPNESSSSTTRAPLPSMVGAGIDIHVFLGVLRTIMASNREALHFTADGLTFHNDLTQGLVRQYFDGKESISTQHAEEALRVAYVRATNGHIPSSDSAIDLARLGRKIGLQHFRIYEHAGGGGNAQVFRALFVAPWLQPGISMYLRYCLRFELIGKVDDQHYVKYCAKTNLIGSLMGSHPNVCPVIGFFSLYAGEKLCFVTAVPDCDECLEDLRIHKLQARGRRTKKGTAINKITVGELRYWQDVMIQVLEGLMFIHNCNIIHRDIKASKCRSWVQKLSKRYTTCLSNQQWKVNILVVYADKETKSGPKCLITDLNDVREDTGLKETRGSETGTAVFRCPDRDADRPYDATTDNFSVGAMLFEVRYVLYVVWKKEKV